MSKGKKYSKRITAFVLVLALLATSIKFEVWALTDPVIYNGAGYDSINEALADARDDENKDIYITITEDMAITEAIEIQEEETVHIDAAEKSEFLISTETDWEENAVNGAVVFYVEKGAVLTLNNIVIKGEKDNSFGENSAIVNNGTLNFYHSKLTEYCSRYSSMKMDNATFNMDEDSEVSNCQAIPNAYQSGTPGITMTGDCYVTGGNFVDNQIDIGYANGGAINSKGTLHISGTTFRNNRAGTGGSIWAKSLYVNDCTFESNSMTYNGGAIYVDTPTADVEICNSTFTNNGEDSIYRPRGGAIYIDAPNRNIKSYGNIFQKNFAYEGGAIQILRGTLTIEKEGSFETSFGNISVGETTFTENEATDNIISVKSGAKFVVKGGEFINNATSGNSVILNAGTTALYDVQFSGNTSAKQVYDVAVYNEETLELYSGANIEDVIMLAEGKVITVKEKLSYPLQVAVADKLGEDFRPIAQYDTDSSEEDAYTNVTQDLWILLSVDQAERKNVIADGNNVGFVNQYFSKTVECKNNAGEKIAGVCFDLYKCTEDNKKIYLGITGTTDTEGKLVIDKLPSGTYLLSVRDLPEGYRKENCQDYTFNVEESDPVVVSVGFYDEKPTAKIVADKTKVQVGEEVSFSGSESTDDYTSKENLKYKWDFGDGVTAEKIDVKHTYYVPGLYLVMLTVTDESGQTNTSVIEINVEESDNSNKLTVQVKSTETGEYLKDVDVYILDENEQAIAKPKNEKGTCEIYLLKNTNYYVYAEDPKKKYLPRETSLKMKEEDKEITLYLSTKNTIQADVTAKEMTYEDIVKAGIDLECDENSHIVKYEIELIFTKVTHFQGFSVYCSDENDDIVIDGTPGELYGIEIKNMEICCIF